MPMKLPYARVNRLVVAIDGEQQMAGQALFRAHKLRLMPQIPACTAAGSGRGAWLAIPAKAVCQPGVVQDDRRPLRWRKSSLIQPGGPRSGEALPQRGGDRLRRNLGDDELLHLGLALPGRAEGLPVDRVDRRARSSSGSAPAAAGQIVAMAPLFFLLCQRQRAYRDLEPAAAEVDDIAVAMLAPVGGFDAPN